jgi:hypothetical protein
MSRRSLRVVCLWYWRKCMQPSKKEEIKSGKGGEEQKEYDPGAEKG